MALRTLTASLLLAAALPTALPPASAAASADSTPPDVTVASYVIADYDTGQILAEKSPHLELFPASTLKILTADTLIPRLPAGRTIDPQPSDFAAEPDGSLVGMTTGVTYSVADLWHAAFLVSGNDAVATLAHMAGGVDHTIALMQQEARTLGAQDTVVVDADGYDADGQVTSAYDLALMARAGLKMPAFRAYCGLREASFPAAGGKSIQLTSHDPMLLKYPGMIGIKGGITTKAGHTYVGAATRGGHTLIETLMLGGTDVFDQAAKLMDWGFSVDGTVRPVAMLGGGQVPAPSPTPTPTPTPTSATTPASTTANAPPSTSSSPSPTSAPPTPSQSSTTVPDPPVASSPVAAVVARPRRFGPDPLWTAGVVAAALALLPALLRLRGRPKRS